MTGEKTEEKKVKFGTEIKRCSCQHDFQDKRYGPQMRVFNRRKEGGVRCTVCGREE